MPAQKQLYRQGMNSKRYWESLPQKRRESVQDLNGWCFGLKTVVHQNHHSSLGLAQTKFDLGQMQRYCSRCIPESDTKMMGCLSAKNQREAGIGRFVPLVAAPAER